MTKPIRILLVDDEYLALQLLEEYLGRLPNVELVDKCKSALVAMNVLQKEVVDLVFLDIQMPSLSGVELLKSLAHPPVVVFTTAYREFAADAFDLNAADYLVKPFPFERFLQAFQKAQAELNRRHLPAELIVPEKSQDFITIKVDGRLVKVRFDDILFVEGLKEYVRIVCRGERHVTLERMKNMEEILPAYQFMRVHKSYIVSKSAVKALEGNQLVVDDHKIPISRSRREDVVQAIFLE